MKSNVMIFGDSYSTFKGFVPEGFKVYYPENDEHETELTDVSQTWWYQVVNEAGFNLVLNNSWSGSTVCYTGYGNADCSKSSSFIYRLKKLIAEGFFEQNKIDKVFIYGWSNDSWCNAPLGEEKHSDFKEEDLYFVLPGASYFLRLLRETLPQAEIYCFINGGIKGEISSVIKKVCQQQDITTATVGDIEKLYGHPTIKGMKEIKEIVLKTLK